MKTSFNIGILVQGGLRMQPERHTGRSNYQVRALERALDILDAFSLSEPELSLTEVATRVELPASTCTRLLATLVERGYLERSPDTDRYRMGLRAFEIGSIYIQRTSIENEARPFLRQLADECRQTANLGVLSDGRVVHIAVEVPDRPIRFSAQVGEQTGAHFSGLGKVLLAELSEAELDAVIAQHGLPGRTRRTITTDETLRVHLAEVRAQGYAFDDEESDVGVKCIAAPVHNSRGEVVAAVSISGPAAEFRDDDLQDYIEAVLRVARGISARLGYSERPAAERPDTTGDARVAGSD